MEGGTRSPGLHPIQVPKFQYIGSREAGVRERAIERQGGEGGGEEGKGKVEFVTKAIQRQIWLADGWQLHVC